MKMKNSIYKICMLIWKDILLIKKHIIYIIFLSVFIPIALILFNLKETKNMSILIPSIFFLSVFFIEFLYYSCVSSEESKYSGEEFLCATPYTRQFLVIAKYVSIIFIYLINLLAFIGVYIIFSKTVNESIIPIHSLFLFSYFFIIIYYSIYFPLEYKYGYVKLKMIISTVFLLVSFSVPQIFSIILKNENLSNLYYIYNLIINPLFLILIFAVSVIIFLISMFISIKIFSRKNL